jgi:hypothetical protein
MTNGFSGIAGMFSKRKPKTVSPEDFMGKEAKNAFQKLIKKPKVWERHIQDAKSKGLTGPWG